MSPILLRLLPYIAALALVAGGLFGAYHHGVTVTDDKWQGEWNARDTRDAEAKSTNEAIERAKEQARQQSINKAVTSGQQIIDTANAALAASHADFDRVHATADQRAAQLAVSQASLNSCTAASSKAAADTARMLANLFRMADQAAGTMAAVADQARARGMTCEQAYEGLGK